MKKALLFLFVVLCFFATAPVYAQDNVIVKFTWTNPTTFDNGAIMPPEYFTYAFLRVYVGPTSVGPFTRFPDGNYTPPYPTKEHTFDTVNPATEYYWYTLKFVVPCDPNKPMTSTSGVGDELNNKCPSALAIPAQYVPGGKVPDAPGNIVITFFWDGFDPVAEHIKYLKTVFYSVSFL